tara:strand:+ start:217 stop:654 length:438 start_codon:yes stop_codon:yes gene_type:complete
VQEKIEILFTPPQEYSFDIMNIGVKQHIDREYTYDLIPEELIGGVLLQNVHRLEKSTQIKFQCKEECTVYFFFHSVVDGGYSKIFEELTNWEKCEYFPKYDIKNPNGHGLTMDMYKTKIAPNEEIIIPPTTKERACCNIVFNITS